MKKPIHVKPNFYTYCFEAMKSIAKELGYNLVLHGSMQRDLDIIAIPWSDTPKSELNLIKALDIYLNDKSSDVKEDYMYSVLPGGRNSYVIDVCRIGKWNEYKEDPQYYIDISITPLMKRNEQD